MFLQFYTQLPSPVINEDFLWRRLEPLLHYLPLHQRRQVHEALCLAFSVHSGQLRKSGEPYITHPVEVTRLLAELRSDHESLIAGLLHDTVEDTTVSPSSFTAFHLPALFMTGSACGKKSFAAGPLHDFRQDPM